MDPLQFEVLAERRFKLCRETLLEEKRLEYCRDNDRQHNFKAAAILQDIPVEYAWRGMFAKHLVSLFDMINDLGDDIIPSQDLIDAKIGDLINYLILFEGIVDDKRQEEECA